MPSLSVTLLAGAVGAISLLSAPPVARANLVTNGGFETGDLAGWHTIGPGIVTVQCANPAAPPHSGNCVADFGGGAIDQSISSVPGAFYTLDFWLQGSSDEVFGVSWNGDAILERGGSFSYTHEVFTNLPASSNSTRLFFSSESGTFLLDDVSVVANATVPEPSTLEVLSGGLSLLGLARFAKRRASSSIKASAAGIKNPRMINKIAAVVGGPCEPSGGRYEIQEAGCGCRDCAGYGLVEHVGCQRG